MTEKIAENILFRRGTPEDFDALVEFIDKNLTDFFMPKSRINTILIGGEKGQRWSNKPSIVWLALDNDEDNKIIGVAFLSNIKNKRYFLKYAPEGLRLLKEDISLSAEEYPALNELVMRL